MRSRASVAAFDTARRSRPNRASVWRRSKRASPLVWSATTRDLSTRWASRSATSSASIWSPAHTASAASSEQPPANTDEPLEHPPLVVEQQVVAPLDDRAERLLAGQGGAGAARQQPEPVVEAVGELLHRDQPAPGGGQLDRERETVEPGADVFDDGRRRRASRRCGAARRRRGRRTASIASSMASGGTGQIVSPPIPRASRLVARIRSRGQRSSRCSTTRAGLADDVLAVVHDHEERTVAGARPGGRAPR